MRHGQAGFFTDEELADSAGILWKPEDTELEPEARLDPPAVDSVRASFTADQVRAFSEGRTWECFGSAYDRTRAHVRTPRIQSGQLLFIDEVTDFDPRGGPWGRGYLRAETPMTPEDWFFKGHFKNDPCMPGTLMFEACFQTMAFYLAGMGTRSTGTAGASSRSSESRTCCGAEDRRSPALGGWSTRCSCGRCRRVPSQPCSPDLLCTVDGLKAFHARRVGMQLVPDWPLSSRPELLADHEEPRSVAVTRYEGSEVRFGYPSLLACAWGRPTDAFGPMYARFDGPRTVPRLPGPPYHFMSRVVGLEAPMGEMKAGGSIEVEYDVPAGAWYFDENGAATMPYCVLLEAALQPCGWLASYVGSTLGSEQDLMFRNLDGTGTLTGELFPDAGTLRTRVRLVNVSKTAGLIVESFAVECYLGERRVYEMDTVFGFFRPRPSRTRRDCRPPTNSARPSRRRARSGWSSPMGTRRLAWRPSSS